MKRRGLKTIFLILISILFGSAAYAEDAQDTPYLVVDGPDMVEVGQSATYAVSTVGGVDSAYEWWWGWRTNDCATIENGVLTALNPGVIGIRVRGEQTGAYAELTVDIVPNGQGGVAISGPDKVAVGAKVQFTAATGGVPAESYSWLITSQYPYWGIARMYENGELEGLDTGSVTIRAVDVSGLFAEKTVEIVGAEPEDPVVSITAGMCENFELCVMLSISGNIPADAALYLAVQVDGVLYFLPNLSTSVTPFRTHPVETFHEKVLAVPFFSIPYKTYTFYAVLANSSFQIIGEISSSAITGGRQ